MARVGHPDPASFDAAVTALGSFHDELWERTGIGPQRTVLGGFSMGAVMSYALGLGSVRPPPAGILALSGFLPAVEGWPLDLAARRQVRVMIAHGRGDPVIAVGFAQAAAEQLKAAGLDVDYRESGVAHQIDPAVLPVATGWLDSVLAKP